tara:strand:+ start:710 stop:1123 length:414 start_codon:yes stop_codon:yes gene_type:complete
MSNDLVDVPLINRVLKRLEQGERGVRLDPLRIETILEQRVKQGEALQDFFLVIPSEDEGTTQIRLKLNFPFWSTKLSKYYNEGVTVNEDREITMRVFFCKDIPHAAVCNRRMVDYPNVSRPKPKKGLKGHSKIIIPK